MSLSSVHIFIDVGPPSNLIERLSFQEDLTCAIDIGLAYATIPSDDMGIFGCV